MEIALLTFVTGMLIGIAAISIYHDYEQYQHEQWIQHQYELAYMQQQTKQTQT